MCNDHDSLYNKIKLWASYNIDTNLGNFGVRSPSYNESNYTSLLTFERINIDGINVAILELIPR